MGDPWNCCLNDMHDLIIMSPIFLNEIRLCSRSGHMRQYLLSLKMLFHPLLIILFRREVAQGLVGPHRFVDLVPAEKGSLQPAQIDGQLLHLVELLLIGAEAPLHPSASLRAGSARCPGGSWDG